MPPCCPLRQSLPSFVSFIKHPLQDGSWKPARQGERKEREGQVSTPASALSPSRSRAVSNESRLTPPFGLVDLLRRAAEGKKLTGNPQQRNEANAAALAAKIEVRSVLPYLHALRILGRRGQLTLPRARPTTPQAKKAAAALAADPNAPQPKGGFQKQPKK